MSLTFYIYIYIYIYIEIIRVVKKESFEIHQPSAKLLNNSLKLTLCTSHKHIDVHIRRIFDSRKSSYLRAKTQLTLLLLNFVLPHARARALLYSFFLFFFFFYSSFFLSKSLQQNALVKCSGVNRVLGIDSLLLLLLCTIYCLP